MAKGIAESKGGVTLEMLLELRGIARPTTAQGWHELSRELAGGSAGHVRAVVGQDLRPGNIWETIELPALLRNSDVTKITTIDPVTGSELIIFEI